MDFETLNEMKAPDGDQGAPLGMVTRDRPQYLAQGAWAVLENCNIADPTIIQKRKGKRIAHWGGGTPTYLNKIGYPIQACCEWTKSGVPRIVVAYYNTSTAKSIIAEWVDGAQWATINNTLTFGTGDVTLLTANSKLWVVWGSDIHSWDGTTFVDESNDDNTSAPDGRYAIIHGGRMWIWGKSNDPSRIWWSDIWDHGATAWNRLTDFLEPTQDTQDPIVGAISGRSGELFVFTRRSIWVVGTQGPVTDWAMARIENSIGCSARNTIRQVGADVYFQDSAGQVRSLQRTISDAAQGVKQFPQSDNIFPSLDTLPRTGLAKASAVWFEDRYILATSGGGGVNNQLWVCETRRIAWSSHTKWVFSHLLISRVRTSEGDRLWGFSYDGDLFMLHEGRYDEVRNGGGTPTSSFIETRERSRGYSCGTMLNNKLFAEAELSGVVTNDIGAASSVLLLASVDDGAFLPMTFGGFQVAGRTFFPLTFPLSFFAGVLLRAKLHLESLGKGRHCQMEVQFTTDVSDFQFREAVIMGLLDNYDQEA